MRGKEQVNKGKAVTEKKRQREWVRGFLAYDTKEEKDKNGEGDRD